METSSLVEHLSRRAQSSGPGRFGLTGVADFPRTSAARTQDVDVPEDLMAVSTRRLRVLSNQVYRLLDRDFPPGDALNRYELLVEEIERREAQAEAGTAPVGARAGFRDNMLFSRFELFSDGVMTGHVKYEMEGQRTVLTQAVVDPRFETVDVEPALIRQVLLDTHRRRVAVVPRCPRVQAFLAEFPQYLALLPAGRY
ncbi:hypothetical protein AC792_12085 [Arthrobacter sp. RIT-PI-e]|uniref:GNAT family N-acetyltransferase n=1 Tax=Arthrobacter sp. RIT-PI-e TaxID=1681197 RepID=UPI0006A1ABF8|nr:N-acetyltransferase [Arthrobacter sp. RIT-PI-e]KNC18378.1 hypothetical protein AC792_12085 [Arthrobacter sp. RIT-PI-e]